MLGVEKNHRDDVVRPSRCSFAGSRPDGYVAAPQPTTPVNAAWANGGPLQVESITFSWYDYPTALEHIQRTLRGGDDGNDFAREVTVALQAPDQHGRVPVRPPTVRLETGANPG
jgi:hypothetical protein